ncbi:type VII toxin-antitoxin system MntA family adenylyltransferase antitoxin [Clostridium gasigenes]|uniref:type VII toxin-antitoxin system MntA family adenylyltransferase antitoxin n=1 Tax=Clostridium gasigenes TaxID=94869 RepID=UPI001A9A6315|nr:nucleotidyltransferase domain-containing protein [Clostridium gasigenes]
MIFEKLNSDNLKNYFIKLGLSTALVFGSVLTDEFNEESDVDIAILSSSKLNIKAILNLELYLEDLLDRPIDVVDLNSEKLDVFIKIEILNNNKLIYSQDNSVSLNKLIDNTEWYYRENEHYFECRKRDLLC